MFSHSLSMASDQQQTLEDEDAEFKKGRCTKSLFEFFSFVQDTHSDSLSLTFDNVTIIVT
jgi:hypothetical protein